MFKTVWALTICSHLLHLKLINICKVTLHWNIQYIQGFQLLWSNFSSFVALFLLRSPDITITKWHMPFVHQQLVCAMEETFWEKGGVKFANINLVSNWTAKFQLNELPFKCSRPWLHTFNPEVNLIWSQRAVQRHNPLIDKANWGEMRVKEQKKREPSQWRRG